MKLVPIEECVNRYIEAIDEVYFIARQLAKHKAKSGSEDSEIASEWLDALCNKVEDMPMDIENIRDDVE